MIKGIRKQTAILIALSIASIIAALSIGVADNIPGLILCYIASTLLIIAVTYTWQGLKRFLILLGASVGGLFISVLLHNAFYALGIITSHIAALSYLMEGLHVTFFCLAVFLCPAGFVVGAAGSIVFGVKKLRARS